MMEKYKMSWGHNSTRVSPALAFPGPLWPLFFQSMCSTFFPTTPLTSVSSGRLHLLSSQFISPILFTLLIILLIFKVCYFNTPLANAFNSLSLCLLGSLLWETHSELLLLFCRLLNSEGRWRKIRVGWFSCALMVTKLELVLKITCLSYCTSNLFLSSRTLRCPLTISQQFIC